MAEAAGGVAGAPQLRPRVLVVAGTDSSGGAGIARDVETLAAFRVSASLAVTAVTAQTHAEVRAVEILKPALVAAQMRTALEAGPIGAVKIGMLATADTVAAVAECLEDWPDLPVVLDPVIASSSGRPLISEEGVALLLARLLPRAALVTPNLPELSILADALPDARDPALAGQDPVDATAARLLAQGCRALLIKGGHAEGREAVDRLLRPGVKPLIFRAPRHAGSMRGTGCMLASAIAAGLASGQDLPMAIAAGKAYLSARFVEAGEQSLLHSFSGQSVPAL
ncbi:hypothetical protein BTR14_17010 [Rhizobium rhizosphaerae]|uniref:hydroxymethylpyrimidine kinase n=1 Tax=Xaviernesmea rhizosphaerae TaxID=1672749 RepID=A0ABX3PB09_9HYPH|nr:hydroxymethylpyrimidine/phosphomethylpyrimidine kinase [Xaviernesmea rhizosphaerae]OQP85062.1 hypothetical protein BTR14_17010 [Xaviernesmea rhizosphaerae]